MGDMGNPWPAVAGCALALVAAGLAVWVGWKVTGG